jgi:hypothetical protein
MCISAIQLFFRVPRPRQGSQLGFGTNPRNATTVTFTDNPDGAFAFAEVQAGQQNFSWGFKDIDVCVYTQGCSGGSQGSALAAGAFDDFTLIVNFDPSSSSIPFDPFPIKFQTTQGSFEFGGGASPTDVDGASPTDTVPEPSALLLLGAGLIGMSRFAKKSK